MGKDKGKPVRTANAPADKKLKPATHVKVRHILCEKQSKVGTSCARSRARCAQLDSCGQFEHAPTTSDMRMALQALEALERIKAGEQFATVSSPCRALRSCATSGPQHPCMPEALR
jgi:hypothetical protein